MQIVSQNLRHRMSKHFSISNLALLALIGSWQGPPILADELAIPKAWDERDIEAYRLPLAGLGRPPALISSREYYALPETNLKTYPVYAPDQEPAGYLDWLKEQEPQPLVDVPKLKTEADWIAAGREVFSGREPAANHKRRNPAGVAVRGSGEGENRTRH